MKPITSLILTILVLAAAACQTVSPKQPPVSDQERFTRQVMLPDTTRILEINHRGGAVTVKGWEKHYLLIEGIKSVTAATVQEARDAFEQFEITAYERPPNRLVLEAMKSSSHSNYDAFIEYTVSIPRSLAIDLDVRHGPVLVSEIDSHVSIDHRFGDVRVESIGGKAQIRSQGGNVTVNSVSKTLKLDTRQGSVFISHIGGDVAIRHQKERIDITDVGGGVILNCLNTEIKMDGVKGRIDLDNRGGDVICENFEEGLRAYVNRGTLKLQPNQSVAQSYYCSVEDGDIILRVPEESSMLLEVEVEYGRIHSDFPMPVWAEKNVSYARGAFEKARHNIRLQVRKGSASILKSIQSIPPKDDTPNNPSANDSITEKKIP